MAATRPLRIALVGERDDAVTAHRAIPLALGHAAVDTTPGLSTTRNSTSSEAKFSAIAHFTNPG